MAKKLQLRGGSTSDHGSFTGAVREVTVDTDLKTLRVHDGSTAGGERLAKFSEIASGSLNNVVEDTTPQLGGNLDGQDKNITTTGVGTFASLDISGNIDVDGVTNLDVTDVDGTLNVAGETTLQTHLNMGDGDIIKLGDGADLQIFHSGSASHIYDAGTGALNLSSEGTDIRLTKHTGGEVMVKAIPDGAVELYHNNAKKIETDSAGAIVSGNLSVSTISSCTQIGRDSNDHIVLGSESFKFLLDGAEDMRLENDGDLHVEGDVIAFSATVSDVALKSDIQMIPNALDKIDEVRGVTFTRHNGQKSAGIIAQELEKVLPEAVREKNLALLDGKKYKTVEYDAIHGLLINCIKELKEQIKELKDGFTK